MSSIIEEIVKRELESSGFTLVDCTAIARKPFQTAVRKEECVVYLFDYKMKGEYDKDKLCLHGHYESEGRNVLSTCDTWLKKYDSAEEITPQVVKFINDINTIIDRSFARNLHLEFGMVPEVRAWMTKDNSMCLHY